MAGADARAGAWTAQPANDFPNYAAGTWGPEATQGLLVHQGHSWPGPLVDFDGTPDENDRPPQMKTGEPLALTVNGGSSSIKFAMYKDGESLKWVFYGERLIASACPAGRRLFTIRFGISRRVAASRPPITGPRRLS